MELIFSDVIPAVKKKGQNGVRSELNVKGLSGERAFDLGSK